MCSVSPILDNSHRHITHKLTVLNTDYIAMNQLCKDRPSPLQYTEITISSAICTAIEIKKSIYCIKIRYTTWQHGSKS